jgi:hypothetical protein
MLSAVSNETAPAMDIDRMTADPAAPAAIPVTTKIPEPMIAPALIAVGSYRPTVGSRAV